MMKPVEEYFVPWMHGQKMYVSPHIELAWREPQLRRMMSNENPHPPSEKVLAAINEYAKLANRYADQGTAVRTKIAEINGLDGPGNVLLGNGSSEIYDMIWRSLIIPNQGDEIIQHTPCFGIYKLRCQVCGGKLVSVPMRYEGEQFLFDPEAVIAAITPKTKAIVIANPNNPTGNFMDPEDFVRIAETGVPFIVDEAYVEFAGMEMSQIGLLKQYKNVFITRTLSKAYGLAGLRFGYLLANKEIIDRISATLIPWNLSTIAMWAGLAAFEDTDALAERVTFNNDQVEMIETELGKIPGLVIFHSHGNYILFDAGPAGKKGEDVVAYAQEKGIILRPQPTMYGSDGFFRITIGTREENEKIVKIIREFFAQ